MFTGHRTRLFPHSENCWIILTRPSCFSKERKLEEGVFLLSFIMELGYIRRPESISAWVVISLGLQESLVLPKAELPSQEKSSQKHCYQMIFYKILWRCWQLIFICSCSLALVLLLISKDKGNMWEGIQLDSLFKEGKNEETRWFFW